MANGFTQLLKKSNDISRLVSNFKNPVSTHKKRILTLLILNIYYNIVFIFYYVLLQ